MTIRLATKVEKLTARKRLVHKMENRREQASMLNNERAVLPLESTPQKRRRNSSSLSYVAVIAHAILSSPRHRIPLSEIYQFIEESHPEFTENRARWKNTVRHNLSLHDCFLRGEVAFNRKGCNWRIHPSFMDEFSRGDFSRHKLSQHPSLARRYESSHGDCYICAASRRLTPSPSMLEFPGRGVQYLHLPQYRWNPWIY